MGIITYTFNNNQVERGLNSFYIAKTVFSSSRGRRAIIIYNMAVYINFILFVVVVNAPIKNCFLQNISVSLLFIGGHRHTDRCDADRGGTRVVDRPTKFFEVYFTHYMVFRWWEKSFHCKPVCAAVRGRTDIWIKKGRKIQTYACKQPKLTQQHKYVYVCVCVCVFVCIRR